MRRQSSNSGEVDGLAPELLDLRSGALSLVWISTTLDQAYPPRVGDPDAQRGGVAEEMVRQLSGELRRREH
jgi:hypothetical protein